MPHDREKQIIKKDILPGGLADHKTNKDFPKKAIKQGAKVEMEHTKDKRIAQEIARDHLEEDGKYYDKLKEVEKEEERKTVNPIAGLEPLKKKPKKELQKSLTERWSLIKADLNHEEAILDMAGDENEEANPSTEEVAPEAMEEGMQAEGQPTQEGDEIPEEGGQEGGQEPAEQMQEGPEAQQVEGLSPEAEAALAQPEQEAQPEEGAPQEGSEEPSGLGESPEELRSHLKEMGYSDKEIEYVMSGEGQEDAAKQEEPGMDHKSAQSEKFKVELSAFQRRQEIELKYFEEELKQKLAHNDDMHKQRLAHNDEDAKLKRVLNIQKKHEASAAKKEEKSKGNE